MHHGMILGLGVVRTRCAMVISCVYCCKSIVVDGSMMV